MIIENKQTITMPPGRYYVGDLCYLLQDEWDECCELFFAGRTDHGSNQGGFTLKDGRTFVCFNTAYGDGEYYDNHDRAYGVDAGCIGLMAVPAGTNVEGGHIINFKNAFECSKEGRGTMYFGDIVIRTDSDNESY